MGKILGVLLAVILSISSAVAVAETFVFDDSLTYNKSPKVTITYDESGHGVFEVLPDQYLNYFYPIETFGPNGDVPITLQGSLLAAWVKRLDQKMIGGTIVFTHGGYEAQFDLGEIFSQGSTKVPLLMVISRNAIDVTDVGFQIEDLVGGIEMSSISFSTHQINPVPEPSVSVLMSVGVMLMLFTLRRRQLKDQKACLR